MEKLLSSFDKLTLLKEFAIQQQLNGKFVKTTREDKVQQYKSRWVYTFNITSDNTQVALGIHQPSINQGAVTSYLYVGIIILRSSMPILDFVDYLPLDEVRQQFILTNLNSGSYIVVPVTTGFYIPPFEGEPMNIYEIDLLEEKQPKGKSNMNQTTSKRPTSDLSIISKNIIENIFNNFDINRDHELSYDELKVFYKYFVQVNEDPEKVEDPDDSIVKKQMRKFLNDDDSISLKNFKNFFFYIIKTQGKVSCLI